MLLHLLWLILSLACIACTAQNTPAPSVPPASPSPPPVAKEYVYTGKPVWQDEFDYTGQPDGTKWGYDQGGHGWGNNELQNYTNNPENAQVREGRLTISALRESSGGRPFSSARLVSKGKGDFLYGRIEVRAKLPQGVGTWPAIWTLASASVYGTTYWPDNGELDIMEHVGFDQGVVHANIHTKAFNHGIGTNKGDKIAVSDASTAFHVYSCDWQPTFVAFAVDGKEYFRFERLASYNWTQWPFDQKQYLIMNIAVGGNWGGQKGVDENIFPQTMEVDYVRVYGLEEKK